MSFISDFTPETSPDELVGLSKQRRFAEQFGPMDDPALIGQARVLQRYVRARHDQTVSALSDLLSIALEGLEPAPKSIVIIEGEGYGWTSGLWMSELDAAPGSPSNPFDEIWFNSTSDTARFNKARYRTYMWRRARYFVSDLLQLCGMASDSTQRSISGLSRIKQEDLRARIRERGQRVLGGSLGGQSLLGLPQVAPDPDAPESIGRVGFVGMAIDENFLEKFIAQLRIAPGQNETRPSDPSISSDPRSNRMELG